jgi:hypothetical protein
MLAEEKVEDQLANEAEVEVLMIEKDQGLDQDRPV